MVSIVVVGGGWAGCAAAAAAARAGARVTLIERTDLLLGTGRVGGIMRNNGRWTVAEELLAMGGGDLVRICDRLARHRELDFPGHRHASLYDVTRIEPAVRQYLETLGVNLRWGRAVDVVMNRGDIEGIVIGAHERTVRADCFIDCTGTAGPQANCQRHGRGCVSCLLRCSAFGGRVSIAARAGVQEGVARSVGGAPGVMSGSCELAPTAVHPRLLRRLREAGVLCLDLPDPDQAWYDDKACEQYGGETYRRRLIALDTGMVKLLVPFLPLARLRLVPGFEAAAFQDPLAGGKGNSVRFLAVCPRDDSLCVPGPGNLLCAGEKAGSLIGHTEAILTGTLAGHNAVRLAWGRRPIVLPPDLAAGDFISWTRTASSGPDRRWTLSGAAYFQRMLARDLYLVERPLIRRRVRQAGALGLFSCSARD